MTPDEARAELQKRGLPPTRSEWAKQELARRGLPPKPPANLSSFLPKLSGREALGSGIAQGVGDVVGGPLLGTGMAGAGAMLGDVGPDIMKQTGQLMALKRPTSPHWNPQQLMHAGKEGTKMGALTESIPLAWGTMKAGGRALRSGLGSLEGVADRLEEIGRLPLRDKLKILLPRRMTGLPTTEAAGQAQGALEKKLEIPTIRESTDLNKLYGVPKTGTRVGRTAVKGMPPLEGMSPEARAAAEKELAKQGISATEKEEPALVTLRVHNMLKSGGKPTAADTVIALRHITKQMAKFQNTDDVGYGMLAEEAAKLKQHLASLPGMEEYAAARGTTHLAHINKDIKSPLPRSPSGDPYRFGIMRGLWGLGALAGSGGRPGRAAIMSAPMSPYVGAAGTVGGALATSLLDPVLGSEMTPAVANTLISLLLKKQRENNTSQP